MYAKCLSIEPHNVVFYVLQATTLDSIGKFVWHVYAPRLRVV